MEITLVTHDALVATACTDTGVIINPVTFLVFWERTDHVSHRLLVSKLALGLTTRALLRKGPNAIAWNLTKHLLDEVLKVGL